MTEKELYVDNTILLPLHFSKLFLVLQPFGNNSSALLQNRAGLNPKFYNPHIAAQAVILRSCEA